MHFGFILFGFIDYVIIPFGFMPYVVHRTEMVTSKTKNGCQIEKISNSELITGVKVSFPKKKIKRIKGHHFGKMKAHFGWRIHI